MALNTPRLHEKLNESMIDTMKNSGGSAPATRNLWMAHDRSFLRRSTTCW